MSVGFDRAAAVGRSGGRRTQWRNGQKDSVGPWSEQACADELIRFGRICQRCPTHDVASDSCSCSKQGASSQAMVQSRLKFESNPTLHRLARMRPRSHMAAFQFDHGNGTCHLSGFQNHRSSWFRNECVIKTYTGVAASNRDRLDARLGGCCRNDRWPPVLGSGYRFHPAGFPKTDL